MMLATMIVALLASAFLVHETAAQAVVQGIPGYKPIQDIIGATPILNLGVNDVYEHIEAAQYPSLNPGDVVIYPDVDGFEYGQDSEHSVYEVVNVEQFLLEQERQRWIKEQQEKREREQRQNKQPSQIQPGFEFKPNFPHFASVSNSLQSEDVISELAS